MQDQTEPGETVRFGVFELDLIRGELRKSGIHIKLQDQPLQILRMLVDHPGEVVTREQIQMRLWPADTFVDFDHGIGTAVKKLRRALGDDAERPRYIETIPRLGFRFISPVHDPLETQSSVTAAPRAAADSRRYSRRDSQMTAGCTSPTGHPTES